MEICIHILYISTVNQTLVLFSPLFATKNTPAKTDTALLISFILKGTETKAVSGHQTPGGVISPLCDVTWGRMFRRPTGSDGTTEAQRDSRPGFRRPRVFLSNRLPACVLATQTCTCGVHVQRALAAGRRSRFPNTPAASERKEAVC